jgi:hypothetical protein
MDVRTWILALIMALAALAALPAAAGELTVTVYVNYGSAYRDGSWVPVDVVVNNEQKDFAGIIEVRRISATGEPQSPFYRVAADCPKGSRKKFRLHAYLQDTDRVSVRLLRKNRPIDLAPVEAKVAPIKASDYLTLVLDREVSDYGFLSAIVLSPLSKARFYRENLKDDELVFLADYPSCFRAFNAVILGDVDPNRVSARHREVLRRYVEDGGVLVAMLGSNTNKYRGTWVEDLLGVKIEGQEIATAAELAARAFGPADPAGAGADERQGMLAVLKPAAADVTTVGRRKIVATRRPLGRGFAIALAVDASGRLLQESPAYRALWADIYAFRRGGELNLGPAGTACGRVLPELTGVKIQPRSSVFAYLGLYFLVAIVGNWLFWDRMKRRELAWLSLIVFSFGFTSYAMYFGTAGRAKATEFDRIEVLHLPAGTGIADLESFVGLLTARTGTFAAEVVPGLALVSDVSPRGPISVNYRRGPSVYEPEDLPPFNLIVAEPTRLEDFKLSASVMRLLRIESNTEQPMAGLEGGLNFDDEGLRGELRNGSGLAIAKPMLLFRGHVYPVDKTADGFRIDLSHGELSRSFRDGELHSRDRNDLEGLKNGMVSALFSDSELARDPGFNAYEEKAPPLSEHLGPYVFGWAAKDSIAGVKPAGLKLDRPAEDRIREVLVIFDVGFARDEATPPEWQLLPVRVLNARGKSGTGVSDSYQRLDRPNTANWGRDAAHCFENTLTHIDVLLSTPPKDAGSELVIELDWRPDASSQGELFLAPRNLPEDGVEAWSRENGQRLDDPELAAIGTQGTRYALSDWRSAWDPQERVLALQVVMKADEGSPQPKGGYNERSMPFRVTAKLKSAPADARRKEWSSWQ